MREKFQKILFWGGISLMGLLFIVFIGTLEFAKSLQKYRVTAPGISDVCSIVESTNCGMSLKDCNSGKEYKCTTNVTVEPLR